MSVLLGVVKRVLEFCQYAEENRDKLFGVVHIQLGGLFKATCGLLKVWFGLMVVEQAQ